MEDLLPDMKANVPTTPKRNPVERWFGRMWHGRLSGTFQDTDVAWDLAFDLEVFGNQFVGSGFLRGSATSEESLAFSISGACQTFSAEGSTPAAISRSMLIAVNDPLPNTKCFMRFELPNPAFSRDWLQSRWCLPCLQHEGCCCSSGSGDFGSVPDGCKIVR